MVLIIPSIPIAHGVCGAQIAALAHETHHADRDIYSQDPIDRARLLRKENSKMLHLQFLDSDPWEPRSLEIIRTMRHAVDIPFGIALTDLPPTLDSIATLLDSGVYRVFLPLDTPEETILQYCKTFGHKKAIPTVDLHFDFATKLPEYREHGIDRVAIDISPRDMLETGSIDWDLLHKVNSLGKHHHVRFTALHGVRGYPELRQLQELGHAFDSLVLNRALNENRFPCQLIWREMEATAAFETTPASNLWSNPLTGRPHI
jgi:phosphoribosylformimino-5-aminoimidazole carboxamide ribotide isomerase